MSETNAERSARIERENMANRLRARASMERGDWEPEYSSWRHGGSYVHGIVFPNGGIGCIASARHTQSGKFESACFPDEVGQHKTRRAAAFAEREHAMRLWREWDAAQESQADA